MEYLSASVATLLLETTASVQYDVETAFLSKIGHPVYDVGQFIGMFFGDCDSQFESRFNLLMLTMLSRFTLSLELDQSSHSGLLSMQLLVRLLDQMSTSVSLSMFRQTAALKLADIAYQIDSIYTNTFTTLNSREQSIKLPDRTAVLQVRHHRLALIQLMPAMLAVSVGVRRSIASLISSRSVDIYLTWTKDMFDNTFVAVSCT